MRYKIEHFLMKFWLRLHRWTYKKFSKHAEYITRYNMRTIREKFKQKFDIEI